jgi:hypothetical protein
MRPFWRQMDSPVQPGGCDCRVSARLSLELPQATPRGPLRLEAGRDALHIGITGYGAILQR